MTGIKADLDVHHVLPVQFWPEHELDKMNLITLCNYHHCHLMIGHLGHYAAYNPLVREDAARMLRRIKVRPNTREAKEQFEQQFSNAP